MKRCYDLVFSLGAACSCTTALRENGLQYATFPFDWLYGSDIVEYAFDYKDYGPSRYEYATVTEKLAPMLKMYRARDYRSVVERIAWIKKRHESRFGFLHAAGWREYIVNLLQYRIYRHFEKCLKRKGIVQGHEGI